jgi:hypothetical protein
MARLATIGSGARSTECGGRRVAALLAGGAQHAGQRLPGGGPGPGAGKTRLAVEVAAGLADRVPDGVWLVELAPLRAAGSVADAVAATLGVRGVVVPWR